MIVTLTKTPKAKPADETKLGFGRIFTDHMFMMDSEKGVWKDERIVPYGPLQLDPAATVLHYGQEIFEGLKAYKSADGRTLLFRAKDNFRRMNDSCERLCMPKLDVDKTYDALCELIKVDEAWVPKSRGTSLYIRPTMIGIDAKLGVDAADHNLFYIICSPSGAYYSTGLAPVKIYVEDEYVRAVRGGTGAAKTGGNYAASLLAGEIAHQKGYGQVLWLDGVERKYVEEVGAMNMFFLFKNELVTPALQGSILPGITRRSMIQVAKDKGFKVSERRISMEEIYDGIKSGDLIEAFGSGTAAVISPVGALYWKGEELTIGDGSIGEASQDFYDTLTGIQYGEIEDTHGWVTEVK